MLPAAAVIVRDFGFDDEDELVVSSTAAAQIIMKYTVYQIRHHFTFTVYSWPWPLYESNFTGNLLRYMQDNLKGEY